MTSLTPLAGHDPGLPALSRRSLLRASPALLVPGLLADVASASPTSDTLPALVAAYFAAAASFDVEDDELAAADLLGDMDRIGDEIEATVATTSAGLIAQITYLQKSYGSDGIPAYEGGPEHLDVPSPLLDLLKAGLGRLS